MTKRPRIRGILFLALLWWYGSENKFLTYASTHSNFQIFTHMSTNLSFKLFPCKGYSHPKHNSFIPLKIVTFCVIWLLIKRTSKCSILSYFELPAMCNGMPKRIYTFLLSLNNSWKVPFLFSMGISAHSRKITEQKNSNVRLQWFQKEKIVFWHWALVNRQNKKESKKINIDDHSHERSYTTL